MLVIHHVSDAADGNVTQQQDAIQSKDDSVQKLKTRQLNFSDEFEKSSGLR